MEYILFILGVAIILLSLFLTYHSQKDNDDYYLESEMLLEIRQIKERLEDGLQNINSNNFGDILNDRLDNNDLKNEVIAMKSMIEKLTENMEEIQDQMNNLKNVSVLNSDLIGKKNKRSTNEENENYQKIKKLVNKGLSLSEVAKELDMGSREVELIWKLNSRREG